MKKLIAADLFCGAGGTSQGAHQSGAAEVRFALNHWQTAVETHSANFPSAKHVNSRLDQTSPSESDRIDLLFASPECTHHSRARGGRPTSDQQRSGAWDVLKWIEHHRPSWVVIENVVEFREWGPVGANGRPLESKRGHTFSAWAMAIRSLGYKIDDAELNAADHGAATSRNRLFVIARKGNRSPVYPEPTHGKLAGGELPGMELQPWRAAAEIIDWSIPCPSVFARKRPLADKTLLRIDAGLRRFVGPYVIQWDHQSGGGSYSRPLSGPIGTLTTKANMGLCVPWLSSFYGNETHTPAGLPVPTITTKDRHSLCVAQVGVPKDSRCPCSAAMRKLCDTMRELGIADIGFRMLQNHELAAAQGFPPSYIFRGNKADVTKQIGNSVSPNVAEAITRTLAG
jgi:DNA (cytosine-5)-methyltransferase 1